MSKKKAEDRQETELRLMLAFLGQDVEAETRQRIKQLTLSKLSELPDEEEVLSGDSTPWSCFFWLDRILRSGRSSSWRRQWKLALPLVIVLAVAGVGYGWNTMSSHDQRSTAQSALKVPDASLNFGSASGNTRSAPQAGSASNSSSVPLNPEAPATAGEHGAGAEAAGTAPPSADVYNAKRADAKTAQTPQAATATPKSVSSGASTASPTTPAAATATRTFSQGVVEWLGQVWPLGILAAVILGYVWLQKKKGKDN